MRAQRNLIIVAIIAALLAGTPAVAEIFHVHLKNGNTLESRYKPKVADWDDTKVVMLTDVGNRITLHMDDVVEITSDTEAKGFGTVIDTTTIVLGWAPNDAPSGDQPVDPMQQWRQFLQDETRTRNYSVNQFVNTEDAGGGGLPSWEFGPGAYDGGSTQVVPVPAFPGTPAPAPQPQSDGGGR